MRRAQTPLPSPPLAPLELDCEIGARAASTPASTGDAVVVAHEPRGPSAPRGLGSSPIFGTLLPKAMACFTPQTTAGRWAVDGRRELDDRACCRARAVCAPLTTPRRPRVSTRGTRPAAPQPERLDSLTATPPKRASFEELRDSWVSMRRSRELVLARESAEVAAPDVSWSDSYVRVTDSGERFAPRVSFSSKVVTPSAILDRIDRLVPVLEPPRDHLEMWLDRRGLGVYAKALKSLGARRVSDLALLEDEDLDAMGFTAQRRVIRVAWRDLLLLCFGLAA